MPIFLWLGWRRLRGAQEIPFFGLRQLRIREGWRLILLGFALGFFGLITRLFGSQAVAVIVTPIPSSTPEPSVTSTPTLTLTPSITPTASITSTASITPTPSVTPSPEIPEGLTVLFRETITPRPQAVFSSIEISRSLDVLNRAIGPNTGFENPIDILYGAFTYDFLDDGVRWTAIWYLDSQIVCSETKPWDGGTGGYGYTECRPEEGWLPGKYEIQMFLGRRWIVSSQFSVEDSPPSSPTP
ncbi:MAG: hypothetical protein V3U32_03620 [Anaerolineales bacterium]